MSNKIQKHWNYIQLLTNTSDIQQKALLQSASTSQLGTIIEIVYNFLKGNITVTSTVFAHLKKYKHFLRKLTDKSTSIQVKKKALIKNKKVIVYFLQNIKACLETQV